MSFGSRSVHAPLKTFSRLLRFSHSSCYSPHIEDCGRCDFFFFLYTLEISLVMPLHKCHVRFLYGVDLPVWVRGRSISPAAFKPTYLLTLKEDRLKVSVNIPSAENSKGLNKVICSRNHSFCCFACFHGDQVWSTSRLSWRMVVCTVQC